MGFRVSLEFQIWRYALLLMGDTIVFLLFIFLGTLSHEGIVSLGVFARNLLPFGLSWLFISPWLGAFRKSTIAEPKKAWWRVPLIWLVCGTIAVLVRDLLFDRPFVWSFFLVSVSVQGALLEVWRLSFSTWLGQRRVAL